MTQVNKKIKQNVEKNKKETKRKYFRINENCRWHECVALCTYFVCPESTTSSSFRRLMNQIDGREKREQKTSFREKIERLQLLEYYL